jgi:carboxyl-terminal processing protease
MIKKIKKFILPTLILLAIFLSYKIGYEKALAKVVANKVFSYENFVLFLKTWDIINKNFVEPEKIDPNKAILEASRGLLRSLDDPYSDILTEKQKKIFEEDLIGSFGGVGFEIGIRQGVLTVIAPLEGTPAERAGLKPGDKILKIDGEDTSNMSLEDAVFKIRGKPGTKVVLTIYRNEWVEPKDFEITRETINVPTVKSKIIKSDIGYIKINSFNTQAVSKFLSVYYDLKNQGASKFIIDLRNNPGGFLEVAVRIAEYFLPRGKVILKEKEKNKKIKSIISEGPGMIKEPIIILINKGSASASEIFAAALRDNLGIKIIGEKSFGKGSVQQAFPLDGKMLKLTTAYWLTPKGEKIEGNGLKPDIEVKDTLNEGTTTDAILDKALEIIQNSKI